MRDLFTEIWESVRRNKMRVALTGFAVAWGIFMLIVLLGAGNGLLNGLGANQGDFISNSMMLFGGTTSMPYDGLKEGRWIRLRYADVQTTQSQAFSDVVRKVTPRVFTNYTISLGEHYYTTSLTGIYPSYGEIEKVDIMYGRFINDLDIKENRKVMVMDSYDAAEFSGTGDAASMVGRYVKADDLSFRVVGIYRTDESQMDRQTFVPFSTLRTITATGDRVSQVIFSFDGLNTVQENEAFEARYKAAINANHRADPKDPTAVWIWNRFTQNMKMNKATSILQIALWIIGIFTLLSGIVGVSNIMLITVKERTHEFGIRKAIGASPAAILRLIITESIAITAFFGYIGMFLGMLACEILDKTIGNRPVDLGIQKINMFLNPTVGLDVALEATLLLIVAGTIAGYWPARKASRVRPVEALAAQ
ncbi:MAG: ABC transporter permease [Bacteroidales bacterium]|nr:ABC transporter permease [Bacteroidales bacterium]